jgi:hypothetical protein
MRGCAAARRWGGEHRSCLGGGEPSLQGPAASGGGGGVRGVKRAGAFVRQPNAHLLSPEEIKQASNGAGR